MRMLFGATLALVMFALVGEATAAAATAPTPAVAGRKVIFFGKGEVIYEAGPIPEDWLKKNPDYKNVLAGKKAGYKCNVVTIFWAVVWKSSCSPVAFAGTNYFDEDKIADPKKNWIANLNKAIAAKYKPGDMKMGFWAKFGKFILGAVLILLIVVGVIKKMKS